MLELPELLVLKVQLVPQELEQLLEVQEVLELPELLVM